ncbi:MAG: hypothetical protein HYR49_06780 [Gammaproteobacteria bacterium]|nr:hypothetical protein [Gammaproteobacteria bacterium]
MGSDGLGDDQRPAGSCDFSVETAGASNFSLSPGNKLRVTLSRLGSEQFSGDYQVNMNSFLDIPYL